MRATLGERFKILLLDAGLTPEQAGKELHVSPRTIRYWISGKVLVPYAAFRLIRILRMYELPQPGWEGWHMHSGMLWSPEGHGFKPNDSSWWGLLVRQARCFKILYERDAQLRLLAIRAGDGAAAAGGASAGAGVPGVAATSPTSEAGRAAKPAGPNLFIEHFRTQQYKTAPSPLGKPAISYATKIVANVSPCGITSIRGQS